MSALQLKIENKIATLEFDQPDSTVNLLNSATMQELAQIINQLAHKSQPQVQALIITSKKEGSFIAGADIKEIEQIRSAEEAQEKAEKGKQILNSLRNLDLITLAVINGSCLGGGLELALACKYRVASFSDRVKIGLPEVKLGLVPGWGGTQRLPTLIGLAPALKMILSGQILSGRDALKYGLVDRLFPETRLKEESLKFVGRILEGKEPITRKRRQGFSQALLEKNPMGRAI
ncbi:MAG: enoyl-CoA hydratase-related protein, partial [Thermodesulfobacteriota bacterium]